MRRYATRTKVRPIELETELPRGISPSVKPADGSVSMSELRATVTHRTRTLYDEGNPLKGEWCTPHRQQDGNLPGVGCGGAEKCLQGIDAGTMRRAYRPYAKDNLVS